VGTDVEPETVRRNRTLAETLCLSDQVEVILERAEVFNPGPVDLVFTSPPYFDRERYSSRDSQSWVFHGKDFDSWIEGFLRPIIRTSRDVLNRGHLVLNVADIKKRGKTYPLVQVVTDVAKAEGFALVEELRMPLSALNRSKPWEPILVFR